MKNESGKGFCKICKKEVVWVNYPDVHYNESGSICTGHSDKQIIDVYVKGIETIG